MPLPLSASKELFSAAYVRAVVAAAGMQVDKTETDYDKIDGSIKYTGPIGGAYSPSIWFQLKCTHASGGNHADYLTHSLDTTTYDRLSRSNFGQPIILIVVYVPRDIDAWVVHEDSRLHLYRCGYWLNLSGSAPRTGQKSCTVRLPRAQRFTVAAVKAMMDRIGQGLNP
jgi:hypothetical protein